MSSDLIPASSTDVATYQAPPTDLAQQMEFARAVAGSGIVPKAYRDSPGSVLVAVNLGASMRLSPAESLYRIHVIEGKPSASAELIAANVRKAGHKLRILHSDTERCTVEITRADDPDHPHAETWTIAEAQAAGLARKDNWRNYPADMLFNRAVARCARRMCSEALYGVIYTDDEARESIVVTQDGPAVRESATDALTPQTESTELEPNPDGITSSQLKKIGVLMREADITDRAVALTYVGDVIGREISSRNDLTKDEASRVIDELEDEKGNAGSAEQLPDAFPDETKEES